MNSIFFGIIYKITNKNSGKAYIGQTVGTLEKRWKAHCKPKNACVALKQAIEKYGQECFSKEIIGIYYSQEDLDNAEIYFIDWHNSISPNGYNLKSGGGSIGRFSQESKAKMSKSHTGKKLSKETRAKMGASTYQSAHAEPI